MQQEPQVVAAPPSPAVSSAPVVPWERVTVAPPSDWITAEPYDQAIRGRETDHVTHLLWARQVNLATDETFYSTAARLETSLAVQHESQWRVQFDPRRQSLVLHWLRVVRGDTRVDHLQRERMRLIQRETQLDRHIIDGAWTLIVVLDDVRPGDVVEAAYTYTAAHPICPGETEQFYVVPPDHVVGRHHFSALVPLAQADRLRWRASNDAPALVREPAGADCERWIWSGEQLTPREPEPNLLGSAMDYAWVQLSTLPDWNHLSRAVGDAWAARSAPDAAWLAQAHPRPEQVDTASVVALIRTLQDEFRYLSVDLEQGGWIPARPQETGERRYGDCKDLAWLSACILRSWGVPARPILVGSGLREQIRSLLPSALVFNHAILEVSWEGNARWFDLTLRDQGGGYANQPVPWFGVGLAVDGDTAPGLLAQPGAPTGGRYDLCETIILDTRPKEISLLEIRLRTSGAQADELRHLRGTHGVENFSKLRLEQAKARYLNVQRLGPVQWRDDRALNECELVELFSFSNMLHAETGRRRAIFDVPANLIQQTFALPGEARRRCDWAMPFPVEIRHEIVIKSTALQPDRGRVRQWRQPAFTASIRDVNQRGSWSKVVLFTVTAPVVKADEVPAYRAELLRVFKDGSWRLLIPWGHRRGHSGRGLGELAPVRAQTATPFTPAPAPAGMPADDSAAPTPPPLDSAAFKESSGGPHRRLRRRKRREHSLGGVPIWIWAATFLALVGAALAAKFILRAG